MTQDEIISMAKEAGCVSAEFWPGDFTGLMRVFERFAALVAAKAAAKEREACVQVCDDKAHAVRFLCNESNVIACAAAIRARSTT